jgi:hypothetical protein
MGLGGRGLRSGGLSASTSRDGCGLRRPIGDVGNDRAYRDGIPLIDQELIDHPALEDLYLDGRFLRLDRSHNVAAVYLVSRLDQPL